MIRIWPHTVTTIMIAVWIAFLICAPTLPVQGFVFSGLTRRTSSWNRNPPPPPRTPTFRSMVPGFPEDGDSEPLLLASTGFHSQESEEEESISDQQAATPESLSRGGGAGAAVAPANPAENVVQGTKATLASSASFWRKTFDKLGTTLSKPFRAASKTFKNAFRSKEQVLEEKLMKELTTMPVQNVETVPNSTVLPNQVVQLAARRAGILGQPLQPASVQEFARAIKRWYSRQGYVLHSVTGATLKPETATAEIQLQEPVVSKKPVDIIFCKELIVDEESGELLTRRQYQEKHSKRRTLGFRKKVSLKNVNTTLVETPGRTKATKIATALQLKPGEPFKWDGNRWNAISGSGVFSRVLRVSPQSLEDGSVQMLIVAQEEASTHMEYGVGTSRYTGSWEGELDFERRNLFGGGESVGFSVRRGAKDVEPSVRLRFSNDNFGLDGGYEAEIFSDFIGNEDDTGKLRLPKLGKPVTFRQQSMTLDESKLDESVTPLDIPAEEKERDADDVKVTEPDYDHDFLVDRRGVSFRMRNPLDVEVIQNSAASCSFERTKTQTGLHENIGSTTLHLGPISRQLPLDARSNVDARITTGARAQTKSIYNSDEFFDQFELRPFAAASATTRQIFPLISTNTALKRPVSLALRHSATTSTTNLPRHEARAQGIANSIRDFNENGRVTSALRGTTELRIPFDIPKIKTTQDGKLVFFGDWLFATSDSSPTIYRKSCVGVGLRKSVQGIPLRYDFSYTWEGKMRSRITLGRDFEA